jgi:quercetin 2,3-dioxygenase
MWPLYEWTPMTFLVAAGPIELRNPGLLMDVSIPAGGSFAHAFPKEWNSFAYIFVGEGTLCQKTVHTQHAVVLDHGDFVEASAGSQV